MNDEERLANTESWSTPAREALAHAPVRELPSGLTAFELREIATWLTIRDPIDAADAAILAEMQTELREWADALSTQETPQ